MRLGGEHKTKLNYSTYQTQFDTKMTKIKLNGEYDYDCIRKTRLDDYTIYWFSYTVLLELVGEGGAII